jgi:hypothetical protein
MNVYQKKADRKIIWSIVVIPLVIVKSGDTTTSEVNPSLI